MYKSIFCDQRVSKSVYTLKKIVRNKELPVVIPFVIVRGLDKPFKWIYFILNEVE